MLFLLLIAVVALFGAGVYRWFHRMPARVPPADPTAVIAPADGVVWQITALNGQSETQIEKKFLGKIKTLCEDVPDAAHVVSIFMSPLDAHVNWSPVDGKVISVKHTPGNFSRADTWKSLWNEKNEILIQTPKFSLKVIQIAGFAARRIECRVKEGQDLSQGQVIGMIRLGSQVSLVLPRRVALEVKPGQKVRGGETVVGRWVE